jgi:hypothetical protein
MFTTRTRKDIGYFCVLAIALMQMLTLACQTGEGSEIAPVPKVKSQTIKPKDPNDITIAAVGDIMLGSPFPDATRMPPNDGANLLKDMTPLLSAADIAFGNMEGPIVDTGMSEKCKPPTPSPNATPTPTPLPSATPKPIVCYAFRMPTRYAKHLKAAGFDVLSVANNHASDFGEAGRSSTRKTLDVLGIKHAGSNRLKYSTAFLEAKGKKIAFVGFAHNAFQPNVNDLVTAKHLVATAAKKADIVIVSFHGGAEGSAALHVPQETELFFGEKRGNLPLFARTVIDAGADLVIGHGPHVLRGMEIYKDRLIAYSLGNFATYGWFSLKDDTAISMILDVDLTPEGKFAGGRINATRQEGRGIPVLDPTGSAIKKVRSLSQSDFPTTAPNISDDGTISIR